MAKQELSHSELVVEPVKPTLRYATALTKEQLKLIQDGGGISLNLYVTNEFWIEVMIFGEHDNDIEKIEKLKRNFPMQGSWFAQNANANYSSAKKDAEQYGIHHPG